MMRFIAVACVLLCLPVSVLANDTAVEGIGGSWQPLKGEHRSVSMTRERVRMDVYRTYYQATADFEFHNNGPATTVLMGFPETGYGDVPERRTTAFSNFTTAVDGRRVPVLRQTSHDSMFNYKAYWVKRVPFTRNQTRRVRVRYRAPVGMAASLGLERFAPYSFTGGNWRGSVGEASLTVTMHMPGTHVVNATFDDEVLAPQRRGNRFTYQWKNWQAQGEFRFSWMTTAPGWLTYGGLSPLRGRLDRLSTVTVPG
jgi:hypothetical protein